MNLEGWDWSPPQRLSWSEGVQWVFWKLLQKISDACFRLGTTDLSPPLTSVVRKWSSKEFINLPAGSRRSATAKNEVSKLGYADSYSLVSPLLYSWHLSGVRRRRNQLPGRGGPSPLSGGGGKSTSREAISFSLSGWGSGGGGNPLHGRVLLPCSLHQRL